MANSTTNLDLISSTQASKEITANALYDAGSPATLYGRRASTTTALTWGYYGGNLNISGTSTSISNGTIQLTASTVNYLQASATTGAVSVNTTGFTTGSIPLYQITTGASTVTSYIDARPNPLLQSTSGFTNPMTTLNDLIIGGANGTATRLAVGASGQVLTVNSSGNVVWQNNPAGFTNPMTTAGDLIVGGTSGTATRLGVGTNGQILGVTNGVPAWQNNSGGGIIPPLSSVPKIYAVKQSILSSPDSLYSSFGGDFNILGSTNITMDYNWIHAFPINLGFNLNNCYLGAYWSASGTGTLLVGFYTDNAGAPGTLVQQFTITTSNASNNVPVLSSTQLTAGLTKGTWYWLAYANATTSNFTMPSNEATNIQQGNPTLGFISGHNQANFFIGYYNAAQVTTLPSTAPTTGWYFPQTYGSISSKTNPIIVFDTAGITY